jgi:hypothetical protein
MWESTRTTSLAIHEEHAHILYYHVVDDDVRRIKAEAICKQIARLLAGQRWVASSKRKPSGLQRALLVVSCLDSCRLWPRCQRVTLMALSWGAFGFAFLQRLDASKEWVSPCPPLHGAFFVVTTRAGLCFGKLLLEAGVRVVSFCCCRRRLWSATCMKWQG